MMRKSSYLIQRLEAPTDFDNPFNFGGGLKHGGLSDDAFELLRPIFSFDYMGAAEFEFGAIPKILNGIVVEAKAENLETFEIEFGSKVVFVIAPKTWHDEVEATIRALASDKPPRTKERVGLREALESDEPRFVGWLEINNGFFFFVDREAFVKTADLFGVAL